MSIISKKTDKSIGVNALNLPIFFASRFETASTVDNFLYLIDTLVQLKTSWRRLIVRSKDKIYFFERLKNNFCQAILTKIRRFSIDRHFLPRYLENTVVNYIIGCPDEMSL